MAPALLTGVDLVPMIAGPSTGSIEAMWRGQFADVRRLGDDLRVDLVPANRRGTADASASAPQQEEV